MAQPLRPKNAYSRIKENRRGIHREQRKPNLPGHFVWVVDATNDPLWTPDSPLFQNSFTNIAGLPIGFRHGLDGQTDMVGMYDLTQGAVSGTVAFKMPVYWVPETPPAVHFPVELTADVWTIAVQTISHAPGVTYGNVKIFWPIVATAYP